MSPTQDIRSRTCEHCDTVFAQISTLRRHLKDSDCQRSRVLGPLRFSARHPRPEPEPDPIILTENPDIGELVSSHPCIYAR